MRKIELGKTGEKISVIGQGTWGISQRDNKDTLNNWKEALRVGISEGMNMIDTAEIYGWGTSEKLVGEVISEYNRDDLFIATKVAGMQYGYKSVLNACNNSLKKLNIKTIDLYQLHWPIGAGTIKGSLSACEQLVKEGKIRYIGVSNFSAKKVMKAKETLKSNEIVSNQIFISVTHPNVMKNNKQLPMAKKEGVTLIAWSPFGHNGFKKLSPEINSTLEEIGKNKDITKYQVALSWLINHDRIMTIPKSTSPSHIKQNAASGDIVLTQEEMNKINKVLEI